MAQVTLNFSVTLDDKEFVKVEDEIYTTRCSLTREEPRIHFIEKSCLEFLKEFEGKLTQKMVNEWLLITKALDQTCSYETNWNDKKIMQELIAGREHPVSWYFEHCQLKDAV